MLSNVAVHAGSTCTFPTEPTRLSVRCRRGGRVSELLHLGRRPRCYINDEVVQAVAWRFRPSDSQTSSVRSPQCWRILFDLTVVARAVSNYCAVREQSANELAKKHGVTVAARGDREMVDHITHPS
jgi:hypothetical protein